MKKRALIIDDHSELLAKESNEARFLVLMKNLDRLRHNASWLNVLRSQGAIGQNSPTS